MTRRKHTLSRRPATGNHSLLQPLGPTRNLTSVAVERIAGEIRSGRLRPGARLPTEQELMTAMEVSRTVIREAVAALRADGLVVTRQGSGAFVSANESRLAFRISRDGLSSIEDVLEVMELRLAIEVEAAALAAERRTSAQLVAVERALRTIDAALNKGDAAVSEDFGFHRAIAGASGNAKFADLLGFLGHHVIPRQSIRVSLITAAEQRRYLSRIQEEHGRIYDAIAEGNPAAARLAMRMHLTRALKRYRALAERGDAAS